MRKPELAQLIYDGRMRLWRNKTNSINVGRGATTKGTSQTQKFFPRMRA